MAAAGISAVDPQRYLALQYELAYTARDIGDNQEALVWYDTLLGNAARLGEEASAHWRTFFTRVRQEARQLRFEKMVDFEKFVQPEGGLEGGCAQQ